ncbi:universal stress protein [Aporhodopirellula aestuarii]|uniref:Universal stress protein n=1 Tax=Aporhodopirellula aestuarii TaxID=2950107 RepID=A0ABT0TYQ2_9BACT|nr:universal stress protein [Aporhodopirellula aestuarii]MCM2369705.1 universal stress protein [Aporhodopirellula aestuarii]
MKILLATDGSAASQDATEFVANLAKNVPVEAVVLTVSFDPEHYPMYPWSPQLKQHVGDRTQAILDKAKQTLQTTCQSVSVIHGAGSAAPYILAQAKKSKVDLIVLGAKGHSALRRVLLGSVSDSVASSAECSVVVVRRGDQSDFDLQKIIVGFDQSVASREAVAELMQWNLAKDCEVNVISVALQPYVFVGEGYAGPPITVDPALVDKIDKSAERMASQIADHFPHTRAQTTVSDHVGDAIVTAAEDYKASMIVVGDTGHSLLSRVLLGSTSKYVLRHAPCSVWISRHHWNSESKSNEVADAVAAN